MKIKNIPPLHRRTNRQTDRHGRRTIPSCDTHSITGQQCTTSVDQGINKLLTGHDSTQRDKVIPIYSQKGKTSTYPTPALQPMIKDYFKYIAPHFDNFCGSQICTTQSLH